MQLKGELEKGGKDMIDMTNFKKSVKWYDENLATLLPQYRGKYVSKTSFSIRTPSEGDAPFVADAQETVQ